MTLDHRPISLYCCETLCARSVPPPSLSSFLCVRGLSLSLSKANFIGCYKFRPFQSPNRRRRRRQPTPRASRGGTRKGGEGRTGGDRCGLPSFHPSLPILPFNVTLTQDCSLEVDASSVASKCFLFFARSPCSMHSKPLACLLSLSVGI